MPGIDDCALQLSHNGTYLDLESTVAEQKDEMEGFLEDPGRGKKHSMILRTQLSVRVHACIEKLYNSNGRELRRALFSLKQIFQDDKDLVHEFVVAEGLTCLIKVGAEADQNYQNYILRALGQIMLYVDGMNGVIGHNETIQWLYTLIGSKFRLVVKTALKLLLVFVEYTESNALLLIKAVTIVDKKRGVRSWSNIMEILDEKDGIDTELLVYAMTLINKTSAGLPDQDSFYDVIDCLEEQGMEAIAQRHLSKKGTDLDLVEQFNIYEVMYKASPLLLLFLLASASEKEPEPEPEPEPELEPESEAERETEGATETRAAELGPELENEQGPERDAEENALLSEKERQNEEVNEKDNCSASSISSASSTLEREEREDKVTSDNENGNQVSVNDQCSNILNNKRFMLDMLYSQNKKAEDEGEAELNDKEKEEKEESLASLASRISILQANKQACEENVKKMEIDHLENQGSVRAFTEKFNSGEISKGSGSSDSEVAEKAVDKVAAQPKKESDYIWDQLMANPRELKIKDMDFTDLEEEDDVNVLDMECLLSSGDSILPPPPPPPPFMGMPPPPPPLGCPPPPPPPPVPGMCLPPAPPIRVPQCPGSPHLTRGEPTFLKKKKTIRLFWNELRPIDWRYKNHKRCKETLWARLEPVKVDISKLEHLFESKSKEIPKSASDGKRQEVIVLDSKRSNAINIGLTVLPPPRTIKTAILNFDEYALNKEGIEKILTMIPTEEEKQKIQEAQLLNPDIPLGTAEQFLLTLSSISELSARLQLWAFKLDYETVEKEVAEPLQDLKEGMDQLENNKSLRYILATLLAIGNFLNASNAKGFELGYLAKVPEVKDTVHKQSLLHHTATIVVEKFPDSSDLYSEIGAITRSAKVDFDQLQENLCQLERRCKASWDHLKAIAKHEMKPVLKQKMSEFLKDCAERIIILKIVHRRIVNRFHAFLLFMGHPPYAIREASIHRFCKIISEFALEYRTTRERVLQQKQKRANHRERNKTRGKMITDVSCGICLQLNIDWFDTGMMVTELSLSVHKMFLLLWRSSRVGSWNPGNDDSPNATDDAADEIMDRIVKSATQVPNQRAVPRERKRSRANRKSRKLLKFLSCSLNVTVGM
uniref:Formin homology 2 domain containing 3 n=1 Tax=Callorhinchus milii TaxID=7868 RepID=A0A4W3KJK4_CALMI